MKWNAEMTEFSPQIA